MSQPFEYTPLPPLVKGDLLENGKYEIISDTENAGGFGRIYRALVRQTSTTHKMREVAVKEFHVHEIDDTTQTRLSSCGFSFASTQKLVETLLGQFRIESKVMYELSRQRDCHVPQLYHSMREDRGRYYYTMSYINGPTLTEFISQHGPMQESVALDYIIQIAKVLYKAHGSNLVHCDVSPNNIMLDHNFAVLVDFGNARGYNSLLLQRYRAEGLTDTWDNMDGVAMLSRVFNDMGYERIGTPGYSAPEEFSGLPQGDIYSLASTLFFMLTGSRPPMMLSSHSQQKVMEALAEHRVGEITTEAIMHALQPQLNRCTQSAREFILELPKDIVFDTLLNYNDHDYNRR